MKKNSNGSFTINVNHPSLGLIPFTATANDTMDYGRAYHALADQVWPWFEALQQSFPDEAARVALLPIEEIATLAGIGV